WPAFGESMARQDYAWAARTFRRALKASALVGLVSGASLLLFGSPVISVWLKGAGVTPSLLMIAGFAAWILVGSCAGTISAFMNCGPLLSKQVRVFGAASLASLALKPVQRSRSEEHTSELQSRFDLVC